MPIRLGPRRLAWPAVAALLALLGGAGAATPAFADAAAGQAAYDRGDYARALEDWQSAADRGDPDAQFGLGTLYEFGLAGLKQDYKQADHWYRLAAAQDYGEAQYRLALIWAVGGDGIPADLAEAYKWATLAAAGKGAWGARARQLRAQLDLATIPAQRDDGKRRAASWRSDLAAKQAKAAPVAQPAAPVKPGGCPGWPFPTLPCTEQFPAMPGMPASPPQSAAGPAPTAAGAPPASAPVPTAAVAPPAAAPAPARPPLAALDAALGGLDCAVLQARLSEAVPLVTGTVPQAADRARIAALARRYFPDSAARIDIAIVPPPLCRSLSQLEAMRRGGLLAASGLGLRLVDSGPQLREGDPIEIEVRAPPYPVALRIDYFALDGRVLHLWPTGQGPAAMLAAGTARAFGNAGTGPVWKVGGAPFGTEEIAVIATPEPLDLGPPRPAVEEGADYLRAVKRALGAGRAGGNAGLVATLLVTTHGR